MRIENDYRQPSHMSYKEYKKKIVKNKKQTFMMFVSIFFVLLLIFLGFAKIMSPDVDIAIGEDNVTTEIDASNTEYSRSGNVDDRLKALQQEDEATEVAPEVKTEDGGLVKIPTTNKKNEEEVKQEPEVTLEEEPVKKQEVKKQEVQQQTPNNTAPAPQTTQTHSATPVVHPISARVVVGFYNTQAQADIARGILQEAGLGVSPHIRAMGAGYTLQVGAYSSKEAANNLANKLLMNNYPARVIIEGN